MFWKRSLAEDAVDRYNHTWAVFFLLLLSFITWLLPLRPNALLEEQQLPQRYRAVCWCPAQFQQVHVDYANTICGHAFNTVINGIRSDTRSRLAAVLFPMPTNVSDPLETDSEPFFPEKYSSTGERDKSQNTNGATGAENTKQYYTRAQIPLILFILALCLKLPHIIWSLISSCFGLNIHQVIQTAKDLQENNQEQAKDLFPSSQFASNRTALLYIVFKILVFVVVIGELAFVYSCVLPRSYPQGRESTGIDNGEPGRGIDEYTNMPLACRYDIRQMQNVHGYLVQCVFVETAAGSDEGKSSGENYQALCIGLTAFLFVLAVVNAASFVGWMLKLTVWRGRVSQKENLPWDVCLLLYMAVDNAGYLVARFLRDNITPGVDVKENGAFEMDLKE